jgi:hypothetical protein
VSARNSCKHSNNFSVLTPGEGGRGPRSLVRQDLRLEPERSLAAAALED